MTIPKGVRRSGGRRPDLQSRGVWHAFKAWELHIAQHLFMTNVSTFLILPYWMCCRSGARKVYKIIDFGLGRFDEYYAADEVGVFKTWSYTFV